MLKAKDIMNRKVVTVKKKTSIKDAIAILVDSHVTGIPVVSDNMRVIGILTELDVLRLFDASDIESKTVSDFMVSEATCLDENDDLRDICMSLIQNKFRRVPILSDEKLVGIISRRDIINHIYDVKIGDKGETEKVRMSLAEALSRIEQSVDAIAKGTEEI